MLWAIAIAFVFRTLVFQPFHIPSGSMKPTLEVGDYLIVSKYSYGYSKHSANPFTINSIEGRKFYTAPERGDIIVFRIPELPFFRQIWIKRIIGLPGDRVQVREGVVFINNEPVKLADDGEYHDPQNGAKLRRYIEELPNNRTHIVLDNENKRADEIIDADNTEVYKIPEDHYFVMGDNRDDSNDSRFPMPGFIPVENIIGRAEIILFSSEGFFLNPLNWRLERFFTSLR